MNSPFELDTIVHECFDPRTIWFRRLDLPFTFDSTFLTRWFDSSLHVHSRLCLSSIDPNLLTPRFDSPITLIRLFPYVDSAILSHRFDSSPRIDSTLPPTINTSAHLLLPLPPHHPRTHHSSLTHPNNNTIHSTTTTTPTTSIFPDRFHPSRSLPLHTSISHQNTTRQKKKWFAGTPTRTPTSPAPFSPSSKWQSPIKSSRLFWMHGVSSCFPGVFVLILVVIFCLFGFLHCFLVFGFGLACTLFLRVLFSPALVLHFCLGFMDLILRVWSLRLCFLGCVFITACVFCFLLRFTSYLPHLLYSYLLLSFLLSPSFFPFHQKHTIPNLLFQTKQQLPPSAKHPPPAP